MSDKNLRKLHVIKCAIEGKCTVKEAAQLLKLSERRIKQLKKEVREKGTDAIIHGNRKVTPPHALKKDVVNKILDLRKKDGYCNSNFLHFKDLLEEREGIIVSYSSLHKIMKDAGIRSPKKHRKKKKHPTRERKSSFGMMLQTDGSPHDWFGIGENQSIHAFIDDATGIITGIYMSKNECLLGYLEAMKQTLKLYGLPLSIYSDKSSVFYTTTKKEISLSIEEELAGVQKRKTQFGRIMDELGIEMFPASSPQAKGRIERLWETLQSRLTTEFALNGISNIEDANKFLNSYVKKFNKKFAIAPKVNESSFIPLPKNTNLDILLSVKISRTTDSGGIVSI